MKFETRRRRFHRLEAAENEPGHTRSLHLPADATPIPLVPPLRPGAVPDRVGRLRCAGSQHPSSGRCGTVLGQGGAAGGRHGTPAHPGILCAATFELSCPVAETYGEILLALPLLRTAFSLLRPGRKA